MVKSEEKNADIQVFWLVVSLSVILLTLLGIAAYSVIYK